MTAKDQNQENGDDQNELEGECASPGRFLMKQKRRNDERLDEALDESFPASDPAAANRFD